MLVRDDLSPLRARNWGKECSCATSLLVSEKHSSTLVAHNSPSVTRWKENMENTVKTLDHLELSILVFSTAGALVVKTVQGVSTPVQSTPLTLFAQMRNAHYPVSIAFKPSLSHAECVRF